jgi:dihydrolipoamide dehydrogenase
MAENIFDLVIIGSGPGGYVGAIRAAQLGLKVAVVEKEKAYGGTCLNVGCIPSKALLDSSEHYSVANHEFADHGVIVKNVEFDLTQMMKRKDKVVSDNVAGIGYLFKKNKITPYYGMGKILASDKVEVAKPDGSKEILQTKNIMIATGSVANELPTMPFNGSTIVSSTEALKLPSVPKKMVVVGAGAIGLELGSVWMRLGADVTVIEFANKICGPMDAGLSDRLIKILQKQGMKFILGAKTTGATESKNGSSKNKAVTVQFEITKDGSKQAIEADVVLVAVGRKPFSTGLGLEELGITKDERGYIQVNNHYQTKYKNIYAIGDVTPGPMLAHKAEEEGVAVAEIIAGKAGHVNYETVPSVIYTWPEFAAVGYTEEDLKKNNVKYNVGTFPFSANGRARAANTTDGMVKVLAHSETDKLLGVHIVGPRASDLIMEAVVCMEFGGASEDLAKSFHAHPTFSEAVREAALGCEGNTRQM